MWRLLLGTMGVKSLVQGLNAAAMAGFEPRTVWSEVRRRNRLATAPPNLVSIETQFVSRDSIVDKLSEKLYLNWFWEGEQAGCLTPPPPPGLLPPLVVGAEKAWPWFGWGFCKPDKSKCKNYRVGKTKRKVWFKTKVKSKHIWRWAMDFPNKPTLTSFEASKSLWAGQQELLWGGCGLDSLKTGKNETLQIAVTE